MRNKSYIIVEGVDLVKRTNAKINPDKVIFNAVLQTTGNKNRNGRIYSKEALISALKMKEQMLRPRGFVGELDHPLIANYEDERAADVRLSTVLWERTSHVITKYWWEGNELWGTIESTLCGYGPEIVKIVKDNLPLGFSLRAIGQAEDYGGDMMVNSIDYIVGYDAVTLPSHHEAVMRQLTEERYYNLQESIQEWNYLLRNNKDSRLLMEQKTKTDSMIDMLLRWE